jgi:hypothetical protein
MRFRMQKSFTVKMSVDVSGGYDDKGKNRPNFLIRPGDILVFDAQNGNNLTVYRNETIAIVMKQSTISIETFVKNGWLEEIKKSAPAPVVPVPAPLPLPVVVEEVKPQEKPKPVKKPAKSATAIATGDTKKDTAKFEDSGI